MTYATLTYDVKTLKEFVNGVIPAEAFYNAGFSVALKHALSVYGVRMYAWKYFSDGNLYTLSFDVAVEDEIKVRMMI